MDSRSLAFLVSPGVCKGKGGHTCTSMDMGDGPGKDRRILLRLIYTLVFTANEA